MMMGKPGTAAAEIRFGTSGWRGVVADEFTLERARIVLAAIAAYMKETGEADRGVLVAHDPRFMAEEFSRDAAELFTGLGIDAYLAEIPTPTPTVSYLLIEKGLGGAVNFTASHNPPQYQGIKYSPSWGGPALPESTGRIEELAAGYLRSGLPGSETARGKLTVIDPVPAYLGRLAEIVDGRKIAASGIRIVYDAIHGAGAGFLDRFLLEAGCRLEVLRPERDVMFGGGPPEPSEDRLRELSKRTKSTGALGLSTDGDADRYGVIGQEGEFYQPNAVLGLLAHYLLVDRGFDGDLARSVATTTLLDRIAAAHGRRCHETPVGFKYIGRMIAEGALALGGEESAGMSIRGHVPEKDGIIACLLVAEMSAATGKTLAALKADLDSRYGPRFTRRVNLTLDEGLMSRLKEVMADPPMEVDGRKAEELSSLDGAKWTFDGGDWVLLRLSGTEPVARLYVETGEPEALEQLERTFRGWITGDR